MGAETGGTNQTVNPQIQKMLTRIGPIAVFAFSTKVSSVGFLYFQEIYFGHFFLEFVLLKIGSPEFSVTSVRKG